MNSSLASTDFSKARRATEPSNEPLLQPAMREGKRVVRATLGESRAWAERELSRLPPALRSLEPKMNYPVEVAPALRKLADEVDRRLARQAQEGS